MACNGFNHPPDCICNFRGGHPGSQPPRPVERAALLGDLAPARERRPLSERRAGRCRKCGMATFYVPGPKGGNYIAAGDGSFLKHRCPKAVPPETLRLKRTSWRRDWFPAGISADKGRAPGRGQLLRVLGLAEGAPFRVQVQDGLVVDVSKPAVCRWSPEDPRVLEIAYVNSETGDLTGTCIRARRLPR